MYISDFSMVITSDHECEIAVEERKGVNSRQREWQVQSKYMDEKESITSVLNEMKTKKCSEVIF